MSTATDGEEQGDREQQQPKPSGARRAVKFGWGLYEQVAAVFAAIGLAALIDHWLHIGWHGALRDVIGIWSRTVRPAVAAVLHVLVTVPLGWMHVHFEVPLAVRDYLAVGLVLLLSAVRVVRRLPRDDVRDAGPARDSGQSRQRNPRESLLWTGFVVLILLFAWPVFVGVLFFLIREDLISYTVDFVDRGQRGFFLLSIRLLSPGIYLVILLALNHWVLS
jgi:hypothetical protein